ncbi:hypothetical protein IFR05_017513, partial [Cadophora sp. M221]
KGDPQISQPSSKHPFVFDPEDYYYNIDLITDSEEGSELVMRNVMPPTPYSTFWASIGPFGQDGIHEISTWDFTLNRTCKYYQLSALGFIWDVPADLDVRPTYRLKLIVNGSDDEHVSGPFRLRALEETVGGLG